MFNSYEEYMSNMLGYHINHTNEENCIGSNILMEKECMEDTYHNDLEYLECYPEIYKIVYPMVCKACMNVTGDITIEIVNKITEEIYINLENVENIEFVENNTMIHNDMRRRHYQRQITNMPERKVENRRRNTLLNDLIRILVIRELLSPGRRIRPFNRTTSHYLYS